MRGPPLVCAGQNRPVLVTVAASDPILLAVAPGARVDVPRLSLEDSASDLLAMAAVQGRRHDSTEPSGHRATATDRNAHVGASLCQPPAATPRSRLRTARGIPPATADAACGHLSHVPPPRWVRTATRKRAGPARGAVSSRRRCGPAIEVRAVPASGYDLRIHSIERVRLAPGMWRLHGATRRGRSLDRARTWP